MDYKAQLDQLQNTIQAKKVEQAKLTERLETLKAEETKLLAQMKELGIENISELKTKLTTLEAEIQENIEKCLSIMK